jgi:UDP-N-acetylglucosamine 2-epimerase
LESGAGQLIGTDKNKIINAVTDYFKSNSLGETREIFGDGHTAERVVRLLKA